MPEDINWLKRRETSLMNELSKVRRKIQDLEGAIEVAEIGDSLVDEIENTEAKDGDKKTKSKKKKKE